MKTKFLSGILLLAGSILVAPNVGAATYLPDSLLFSANLANSGDATETQALADFLGVNFADLTLIDKVDNANLLASLDDGGNWFIDVAPTEPGYFMLMFGVGGTGVTNEHYYFENINELTKLVWTNAQVNNLTGGDCGAQNTNACNIGRLSHYALFDGEDGGGPPIEIPEPAVTALLGIGLLSLAFAYPRRAKI